MHRNTKRKGAFLSTLFVVSVRNTLTNTSKYWHWDWSETSIFLWQSSVS